MNLDFTRYFAFLRAVNTSGRYLKMEVLRGHFEALGFGEVATFIGSGNVIFKAPAASREALEGQIEAGLLAALGYETPAFVRTVEELREIAAYAPFEDIEMQEDHMRYVVFLKSEPSSEQKSMLRGYTSESERLHFYRRELYWLRYTGRGETNFDGSTIERALGGPATVRNVNTVRRMAGKFGGS